MYTYETNRTIDSAIADKDIFDVGFRDNLLACLTEDPYFVRLFNTFRAREQIQQQFTELNEKKKFEYLVCIYFCLNSELETFVLEKLKAEREMEERTTELDKSWGFKNKKLMAENENLNNEIIDMSFKVEKLVKENFELKQELEDSKSKFSSIKRKLKEVQLEYSKIQTDESYVRKKEILMKKTEELNEIKSRYEAVKDEVMALKKLARSQESDLRTAIDREAQLTFERNESQNKANKLSEAHQNCKCYRQNQEHLSEKLKENEIELDDFISEPSMDINGQQVEANGISRSEVISAKIVVNACQLQSKKNKSSVRKRETINKDYSITLTQIPPLKRISTTKVNKQPLEMIMSRRSQISNDQSKEVNNEPLSNRSTKTVGTNLDEFEIKRGTSFNYGEYGECTENNEENYNTFNSASCNGKRPVNSSNDIRKKSENVSKSSLLSHQSLIKPSQSYVEESDFDQSKDFLMISTKNDNMKKNNLTYDADYLDHSKWQTQNAFDSYENNNHSEYRIQPISINTPTYGEGRTYITLDSLGSELINNTNKLILEGIKTEQGEQGEQDNNNYSFLEDFTPK